MTELTMTSITSGASASEDHSKAAKPVARDWTPVEKARIISDAQAEATGGSKFIKALAR